MTDGERQLLADAARECVVPRHAFALADWVGEGRPVTAKGVLRRADVPVAAQVIGIYPSCVDGRGYVPVEDWGEADPAWIPLDQADINARLARGRIVTGTSSRNWTRTSR